MSGRGPTHDLARIQAAVRQGRLRITYAAFATALEILCDREDIAECVLGLAAEDFWKSMPSEKRPGLHQDVYRRRFHGFAVYLKLQLTAKGEAVVISFKRDESA